MMEIFIVCSSRSRKLFAGVMVVESIDDSDEYAERAYPFIYAEPRVSGLSNASNMFVPSQQQHVLAVRILGCKVHSLLTADRLVAIT